MTQPDTTQLQHCIQHYQSLIKGLKPLNEKLACGQKTGTLLECYEQTLLLLEQAMWSNNHDFHELLHDYQALFREQDVHIRQHRRRRHFIISIPVADRPPHLQATLESIYQVCKLFGYGGNDNGVYDHISIIVAEDSRHADNIQRHLDIIKDYTNKGLQIYHFDQDEQYELMHALPDNKALVNILSGQPKDRFYLKGQAANRNLSYLKCLQLTEDRDNTLYFFIDCDQSLCVNRLHNDEEEVVYALNYFHYIDTIFHNTDTRMLTGKMVGDPPVSPSVMASNFLDDVIAFFSSLAGKKANESCQYHNPGTAPAGDVAYHDMAKLFGYEKQADSFPYRCGITGEHDHCACLAGFSRKLNAFFFGEHLTRRNYFNYNGNFTDIDAARTIYPGNYIVNFDGLKYIIPFGHLRLRMSGPTAGRLIAAEIGERFASFNMPNLHRRTTEAGLNDDFRPGVELGEEDESLASIDLSNEFERQFFGDLMLFSTAELVKQVDVNTSFDASTLVIVIDGKEQEMLELYQQKHEAVLAKAEQLRKLVFAGNHWWQHESKQSAAVELALRQIGAFLDNMVNNFGEQSQAWQQIQSVEHRTHRKQQLLDALLHYHDERDAWDRLFQ